MSRRNAWYTQREWDRTVGIGVVPASYKAPMSKDDPDCQADCECHDMPDVSVPVEMTSEARAWFKEQGLLTPEEVRQNKMKISEEKG